MEENIQKSYTEDATARIQRRECFIRKGQPEADAGITT